MDYLHNGKFEITKRLSPKMTLEYLDKKEPLLYATKQREKMNNIGASIEADSRMQFWETHITEQYLSLLDIANIDYRKNSKLNMKQRKTLAETEVMLGSLNTMQNLYSKLCKMQRFDIVSEVFEFTASDNYKGFSFADFFAGRGTWLKVIKSMFSEDMRKSFIYIYNELDFIKYKENSKDFTFSFNEPAEVLLEQFPKETTDLVIFNPPYGSNGDRRNANIFLEHLIKSKVMKHEQTKVIFVLNKKDIIDSMDLISSNFRILDQTTKKLTNKLEFDKLNQYYFVGIFKPEPLESTKTKVSKMSLEAMFDREEVPNIKTIPNIKVFSKQSSFTSYFSNFDRIVDFGVIRNLEDYTAPPHSKSVNKAIGNLIFKHEDSQIFVPKPLTPSELSFFVATGKLNGDFEVEINGKKETITIASGIEKKVEIEVDDEYGKEYETTKSVPFMSLFHKGSLKTIQYETI